MKRLLSIVLTLVLLLSGCNYNTATGGGTEPSDILGSMPTNPTPASTNPTTEPTAPTTEPTVIPTDYLGNDITEELIAAAVEWAQVTDYHAEIRVDEDNDYHVILDDGKYIYDVLVWSTESFYYKANCTPKAGTVYPNGPALPPGDMTEEEFRNTYTILDDEIRYEIVRGVEMRLDIACAPNDVINGLTILAADGKPVFCHHGVLYVWESDNVFRECGSICHIDGKSLRVYMVDGAYVFSVDFDYTTVEVLYTYKSMAVRARFKYEINGASPVRFQLLSYESAEVRCVHITEEGEIELAPYFSYYSDKYK